MAIYSPWHFRAGLMLFDPTDVSALTSVWGKTEGRDPSEEALPPTAVLLAYDAVKIAAKAHLELNLARNETRDAPGDCNTGRGAFHADSLLNYLRAVGQLICLRLYTYVYIYLVKGTSKAYIVLCKGIWVRGNVHILMPITGTHNLVKFKYIVWN